MTRSGTPPGAGRHRAGALRPRVVLFLNGFDRGGTERHTIRLANALDRSGLADVWVGSLEADGPLRSELAIPPARVLTFPLPAFYSPSGCAQIVRFTRRAFREEWNILQGQDPWGNLMCSAARAILRKPRLIASRRFEAREATRLHHAGQHVAYRMADAVVFNSQTVAARLVAEGRVEARRCAVIPNCVHVGAALNGGRNAAATEAGSGPRIGIVARLEKIKDHATLVRAIPRVVARFPTVEFVLVGDGSEAGAIESLARSLGVSGHLTMAGDQGDVAPWLRSFDLATLTSTYESSPNAVLEYMAAGLPIVATRVGGVPDLVRDGVEARLVAPGDPEALANAMVRVLEDPAASGAMGRAARERAESFSVDAMVRRTLELYQCLLAGDPLPASIAVDGEAGGAAPAGALAGTKDRP